MGGAQWQGGLGQAAGQVDSRAVPVPRALAEPLSPTWAATVCDLVGKSFVMQAVLNPASERPNAARKPAPPAPTTTASNSWSTTGYCAEICKREVHPSVTCSATPLRLVTLELGESPRGTTKNRAIAPRGPPSCTGTPSYKGWRRVSGGGTLTVRGASTQSSGMAEHLPCGTRKPTTR